MIEQVFEFFSGMGDFWALFLVSMIPFIELRAAIPFGMLFLKMPWYEAFLISFVSNCIPIPFIMLLARPVIAWLKKTKLLAGFANKLEAKMMKKSKQVTKYEVMGLFLLVAIPLPGTGAYSGSLIAALLNMRMKKAIPSIVCGVFVAGIVVTILSACGVMAFS